VSLSKVLAEAEMEARQFLESLDRLDRVRLMGRKPTLIMAALTYIYANKEYPLVTQKQVARHYGVSEAGLCQAVKTLSLLTGIKPKKWRYKTLFTVERVTWKKDVVTIRFKSQSTGYDVYITLDTKTTEKLVETLQKQLRGDSQDV